MVKENDCRNGRWTQHLKAKSEDLRIYHI